MVHIKTKKPAEKADGEPLVLCEILSVSTCIIQYDVIKCCTV